MKFVPPYCRLVLPALFVLVLSACSDESDKATDKPEKSAAADSANHGYNELANPDSLQTFGTSDFNTDNSDTKNIERPARSLVETKLDTALLFGIWTSDPNGPHADFDWTGKSFYVVDYDGNGDMPYELTGDELKVYYNDFIQEGRVVGVSKDTLRIRWRDFDNINNYVRWAQ